MRLHWTGLAIVVTGTLAAAVARAEIDTDTSGNPKNGLSSKAFLRNALTTNAKALGYLTSYSLTDLMSELAPNKQINDLKLKEARSYVRDQLGDPQARAVAEELVSCALDNKTTLSYVDPRGQTHRWRGELGLCQTSELDDWSKGAPTLECQRLVTACIMARVNALEMAVPISLRGPATPVPSPRKQVGTEMTYRESSKDEDPSKGRSIPAGPEWKAAFVGRCAKGEQIKLALQGPSVNVQTQVRVCAGIHGCTGPGDSKDTDVQIEPSRYKQIAESAGASPPDVSSTEAAPTVELTCPSDIPTAGYYSVMIKHGRPSDINRLGDKKPGDPEAYPAPEKEVFKFLEGAFYGNLFDVESLLINCDWNGGKGTRSCKRPLNDIARDAFDSEEEFKRFEGVPYGDAHACYSQVQQANSKAGALGVAYLNSRICTLPEHEKCFLSPPKPCTDDCKLGSAGVFENCRSSNPSSSSQLIQPITVYLNEPCDLIGDGELCQQIRNFGPKPCSGCCCGRSRSCSAGGGALRLLPGAAVLVLLLRRKRRPLRA